MNLKKGKVLLYSGGMDSWLIDKIWKPDTKLFIDIGTKSNQEEIKRLPKDVIVKRIDISEFEDADKNYLLPLRNLFFIMMASYYGDEICLGATGSSTHFDKNEKFAKLGSEIINYLYSEAYNHKVKVVMPFKDMSKSEILKMYLEQGGDIDLAWNSTFSCYNPKPNGEMCGECSSCKKRIEAFKNNGYKFDKK